MTCTNMQNGKCPRQEWIQTNAQQQYILENMGILEGEGGNLTAPCSRPCCVGCDIKCVFHCSNAMEINKKLKERKERMAKKKVPVMNAPDELDNRKFVIDRLKSIDREGMDDLIDYMDEIGFFEAPCSGGNHLCCKYGLVQHTRNVMVAAENIGYALLGKRYEDFRDSVILCSALHDLGKCGDFGLPMYVPNMIKNKKYKKTDPDAEPEYVQSEAKPYERNKELKGMHVHSVLSYGIILRFIDLTLDEAFALVYHDGLYDRETGGMAVIPGHETPLYFILHWADMWSAHITETKALKEDPENITNKESEV